MKKAILTLTVLIMISFTLLTHAQQAYQFVRADVPFDFQVSGKTMAAGRYDFCWNRTYVAAVRLADQSARSSEPIRYMQVNDIGQPTKDRVPRIVFHRVGSLYFLAEIHQPDEAIVALTTLKQERNFQKLATTKVEVEGEAGK